MNEDEEWNRTNMMGPPKSNDNDEKNENNEPNDNVGADDSVRPDENENENENTDENTDENEDENTTPESGSENENDANPSSQGEKLINNIKNDKKKISDVIDKIRSPYNLQKKAKKAGAKSEKLNKKAERKQAEADYRAKRAQERPNSQRAQNKANKTASNAKKAQQKAGKQATKASETSKKASEKLAKKGAKSGRLAVGISGLVITAVIVIILVGIIVFITSAPGAVIEMINDFIKSIFFIFEGNKALIEESDIIEVGDYLESMGWSLLDYGFIGEYRIVDDGTGEKKYVSKKVVKNSGGSGTWVGVTSPVGWKPGIVEYLIGGKFPAGTILKEGTFPDFSTDNVIYDDYYQYVNTWIPIYGLINAGNLELTSRKKSSDYYTGYLSYNEDGTIKQLKSKYIEQYLVNDLATYEVRRPSFTGRTGIIDYFWARNFEEAIKGFSVPSGTAYKGINLMDVEIDKQTKKMTITKTGPTMFHQTKYWYDLQGWTGRYGMPLEFLLSLHLATMAPDFVYKVATENATYAKVSVAMVPIGATLEVIDPKQEVLEEKLGERIPYIKSLIEISSSGGEYWSAMSWSNPLEWPRLLFEIPYYYTHIEKNGMTQAALDDIYNKYVKDTLGDMSVDEFKGLAEEEQNRIVLDGLIKSYEKQKAELEAKTIDIAMPFITKVTNNWMYSEIDFTKAYEVEEGNFSEKIYPYQYVEGQSDMDDLLSVVGVDIKETRTGRIKQKAEPELHKNKDVREWMNDTYYIFDGNESPHEGTIEPNQNVLQAIASLENTEGEDAQHILRMLKEFLSDYRFTFESAASNDMVTREFIWIIPQYTSANVETTEYGGMVIRYTGDNEFKEDEEGRGLDIISPGNATVVLKTEKSITLELEYTHAILTTEPEKRTIQLTINGINVEEGLNKGDTIKEADVIGQTRNQDLTISIRAQEVKPNGEKGQWISQVVKTFFRPRDIEDEVTEWYTEWNDFMSGEASTDLISFLFRANSPKYSPDGTKYEMYDDGGGIPTIGKGDINYQAHRDKFSDASRDYIDKLLKSTNGTNLSGKSIADLDIYVSIEEVDKITADMQLGTINFVKGKMAAANITLEQHEEDALVAAVYHFGQGGVQIDGFIEAYKAGRVWDDWWYKNGFNYYKKYFKGWEAANECRYELFTTGNYNAPLYGRKYIYYTQSQLNEVRRY